MFKILSFDPGMTNLGWALSEYSETTGKFIVLKHGVLHPIKQGTKNKEACELYGQRIVVASCLKSEILDLLSTTKPKYVVTEDAFYNPSRPQAYISLTICIHSIEQATYEKKLMLSRISPRSVKLAVCGSGAGSKTDMQTAVLNNEKITFKKKLDKDEILVDHEADAIGVGFSFTENISLWKK